MISSWESLYHPSLLPNFSLLKKPSHDQGTGINTNSTRINSTIRNSDIERIIRSGRRIRRFLFLSFRGANWGEEGWEGRERRGEEERRGRSGEMGGDGSLGS